MSSYDFIDAAGQSYSFAWKNRELIFRLALIPFIIKVISLLGIYLFGLEENYLRQGLILIPSDFVESLFVVLFIRYALYQESPIFVELFGQHDDPVLKERQRVIFSGAIMYLLIKVIASIIAAMALSGDMPMMEQTEEPNAMALIGALLIFAFGLWSFRLLWLHIPATMGVSLLGFLHRIRGFSMSFILIATWLLCFVPMVLVMILLVSLVGDVFPDPEEVSGLTLYRLIVIFLQCGVEIISTLIASVAVAFGIQYMMEEQS